MENTKMEENTTVIKIRNSFMKYFSQLRSMPRDNNNYFMAFLQQVKLKNEKYRPLMVTIFTKWFIHYIASLVNEQVINSYCFLLVGPQGIRKTELLSTLMPENFRDDFLAVTEYTRHSEFNKILSDVALINLTGLPANVVDMEALKSSMTIHHVVYRKQYHDERTFARRISSICGSTNSIPPESRRFLSFEIESVTIDEDFPINQLYRQAYDMLRNGYDYNLTSEEIEQLYEYRQHFAVNNGYLRLSTLIQKMS